MSSGPTLHIGGESDLGATEITNIDDFDLGLLGNQRKISGTPPAASGVGKSDGVEFVNLEDTSVSFNVQPTPVSDTIKILRDTGPKEPAFKLGGGSAFEPIAPAPVQAVATTAASNSSSSSWFSLPGSSETAASSSSSSGGFLSGFTSMFSGGGNNNNSTKAPEFHSSIESGLTPEQEAAKKAEGLTMLERMDRKGIGGTKMSAANTLDEINAEVSKRKDSKGLEASIRFQRSMLTTVTSGMEFLNSRYDPLGVHLDGWSEQVNENVEDYDEIFEELYDKYKDKSKVAPEVRLIMSLGLSAAMCHVTNTMFKSKMPGMDDILRNNPGLKQQFAQAAAREVGPGFGNFMGLGGSSRPMASAPAPARQPPMPSYPPMSSQEVPDYGAAMDAPMGGMRGPPAQTMDPRGPPAPVTVRREMRGPTGVDDILQKLQAAEQRVEQRVERRMEGEDGGSVGSAYTTDTMRRNGVSASSNRKRKTAQPTGGMLTLNV